MTQFMKFDRTPNEKKNIKNESTHIEQNRTAARFCNQTRNANKFFELSFGGFQQQNQ